MALVASAVLAGCGQTDRPEGVVERWLLSLNQGAAGEPGRFADDALSEQILPGWQQADPGELDVIEVGRGATVLVGVHSSAPGSTFAPYRVQGLDGPEVTGIAQVEDGRVVALLPADPSLAVPSEGGARIGESSPWLWAVGVAAGLVLCALSMLVMWTVGRERAPA
jgi:hypothetical protein